MNKVKKTIMEEGEGRFTKNIAESRRLLESLLDECDRARYNKLLFVLLYEN